jgi:hypothetical protein
MLLCLAEKTIKALMEGKIDPDEIDKKEVALKEKQRQAEERRLKKLEDEERRKRHVQRQVERKKWGFVGRSVTFVSRFSTSKHACFPSYMHVALCV